ncbi:MAG: periplasmic heavy metal sensor [Methylotetracoccus sp.]|nr:periplasmic heavy metal sensor [Methylotetracoccus sp.]
MSETSTPPTTGGPSGGRRWLLISSLALNLLFIGGVGALWFKGPPGPGHWGPSQTAFGIMRFSRELPPERRAAVRQHLKEARQGLKDLKAELRLARQKAAEVLASTSYTPEQLKTALDAIALAENRMRDTGTAALLKSIGELTPEERQKLAAGWTQRLQKEQRRKNKSDKEGASEDTPEKQPKTP